MKRTFIAIKVNASEKITETFEILKEDLNGESVRWTDINKMHVTLAFLGDTSEDTIKEVSAMLRQICDNFKPFDFSISKLGIFKSLNDPRVIWAGIENSEKLSGLFSLIKSGLDLHNVVIEERAFKPHLTLGRIKWIKNKPVLEDLLKRYSDYKFQDVNVTEVIYYESVLQSTGSIYIPIKTFRLS